MSLNGEKGEGALADESTVQLIRVGKRFEARQGRKEGCKTQKEEPVPSSGLPRKTSEAAWSGIIQLSRLWPTQDPSFELKNAGN